MIKFKLLLWIHLCFWGVVCLILGLLSLIDLSTITFNGKPQTGIIGFLFSILYIPLFGLLFAASNWLVLKVGFSIYKAFFAKD